MSISCFRPSPITFVMMNWVILNCIMCFWIHRRTPGIYFHLLLNEWIIAALVLHRRDSKIKSKWNILVHCNLNCLVTSITYTPRANTPQEGVMWLFRAVHFLWMPRYISESGGCWGQQSAAPTTLSLSLWLSSALNLNHHHKYSPLCQHTQGITHSLLLIFAMLQTLWGWHSAQRGRDSMRD